MSSLRKYNPRKGQGLQLSQMIRLQDEDSNRSELAKNSTKWQTRLQQRIGRSKSVKIESQGAYFFGSMRNEALANVDESDTVIGASIDETVSDIAEDCCDPPLETVHMHQINSDVGSRQQVLHALGLELSIPFPFNLITDYHPSALSEFTEIVTGPIADDNHAAIVVQETVKKTVHKRTEKVRFANFDSSAAHCTASVLSAIYAPTAQAARQIHRSILLSEEERKASHRVSAPFRAQKIPLSISGETALPPLKEAPSVATTSPLPPDKVQHRKARNLMSSTKAHPTVPRKNSIEKDFEGTQQQESDVQSKQEEFDLKEKRNESPDTLQDGHRSVDIRIGDEGLCGWGTNDDWNPAFSSKIAVPARISTPPTVGAFLRKYEFEGNSVAMAIAYCRQCVRTYSLENLKGYMVDTNALKKELRKLSVAVSLATACKQLMLAHDLTSQANNMAVGLEHTLQGMLQEAHASELEELDKTTNKMLSQLTIEWQQKEDALKLELELEKSRLEILHTQQLADLNLQSLQLKTPFKLSRQLQNLRRTVDTLTKQKDFLKANEELSRFGDLETREQADWQNKLKKQVIEEQKVAKEEYQVKLANLSKAYKAKWSALRIQRDAEVRLNKSRIDANKNVILQRSDQIIRKRVTDLRRLFHELYHTISANRQDHSNFLDLFPSKLGCKSLATKSGGNPVETSKPKGKSQTKHAKVKVKAQRRTGLQDSNSKSKGFPLVKVGSGLDAGRVLVCGGNNGTVDLSCLDVTATQHQAWVPLGKLKTPRCWFGMVVSPHGQAWIFGGQATPLPAALEQAHRAREEQEPSHGLLSSCELWTAGDTSDPRPGPLLKAGRREFAAAWGSGRVLAMGGITCRGLTASVEALETLVPQQSAWRPCHDMPGPRRGHVAVTFGHLVYVFGGHDGQQAVATVWAFSDEANGPGIWFSVPEMPRARVHAGAATIGDAVYLIGGHDNDGVPIAGVDCFRPREAVWETVCDMPTARWGCCVAVVGYEIWVMGGCRADGSVTDLVERLDVNCLGWRLAPPLRYPRAGFAAAALSSHVSLHPDEPTV